MLDIVVINASYELAKILMVTIAHFCFKKMSCFSINFTFTFFTVRKKNFFMKYR